MKFSDDFSGTLSNWTALSGRWATSNGWLVKTSADSHDVIRVNGISTNRGVAITRLEMAPNVNGIAFNISDATHYYIASLAADNTNDGTVKLWTSPSWSVLASANTGWSPGEYHTLKCIWYPTGSNIRVKLYADSVLKIDYVITTPSYTSGYIGLGNYYCTGSPPYGDRFDDFNYTDVIPGGGAFLFNFV